MKIRANRDVSGCIRTAFPVATQLFRLVFNSLSDMPPKKAKTASKTTALTRTGPKEVISHPSKSTKRKEYVEKPTTTRALVLRNGKHGAMGTGEVFMLNKITGKEKLDLLAGKMRPGLSFAASRLTPAQRISWKR